MGGGGGPRRAGDLPSMGHPPMRNFQPLVARRTNDGILPAKGGESTRERTLVSNVTTDTTRKKKSRFDALKKSIFKCQLAAI